jgi:hypothetical protein
MTYKLLFDVNTEKNYILTCENTALLNMTLRSFLVFCFAYLLCHTNTYLDMVEYMICFDITYNI